MRRHAVTDANRIQSKSEGQLQRERFALVPLITENGSSGSALQLGAVKDYLLNTLSCCTSVLQERTEEVGGRSRPHDSRVLISITTDQRTPAADRRGSGVSSCWQLANRASAKQEQFAVRG